MPENQPNPNQPQNPQVPATQEQPEEPKELVYVPPSLVREVEEHWKTFRPKE